MVSQPADKGVLLKDILQEQVDKSYYLSDKAIELMIKYLNPKYEITEKSPTLTTELAHTIGKNISPKLISEVGVVLYNRAHGNFKGSLHTDKSPTIRCQVNGNILCLTREYLRRLTPIECERLQTLPDNYTE
ncbi:MAG: DNA cytosine methyltransferase [bacterium]|nr:DNA cytosine methyltransferase [bacterium]